MNDVPTNRELATVARKAAEIIVERGKATGVTRDEQGRVCAIGALSAAAAALMHSACDRFQPSVPLLIARRCGKGRAGHAACLAFWSDLPTTTAADIAKTFLQVADDLEVAP